jgi:hypothetical protein
MKTEPLVIGYTNWKGEWSMRRIEPLAFSFGATPWHPEPQWLLSAWDFDRDATRLFALKDFGPKSAPLPFQDRVAPWLRACFGPTIAADQLERGDRLLEEVLELLQSGAYPPERVAALTAYVWGRPVGEPSQEAGGVLVTLAAYCLALGIDMHEAGEVELARINVPENVAKIRAKQAAKPAGSALPIAVPEAPAETATASNHFRPLDEEAKDAGRLVLCWEGNAALSAHWETGWWQASTRRWVNTYGHPFGSTPTHYLQPEMPS